MFHWRRTAFLVVMDIFLVNLALFISFYLRLEERLNEVASYVNTYVVAALAATVIIPLVYKSFGLYRNIWRYASIGEVVSIFFAGTVGVGIVVVLLFLVSIGVLLSGADFLFLRLPHIVSVLFWLSAVLLTGGVRFFQRARLWRTIAITKKTAKKILIIGAGDCGDLALRELKNREYQDGVPVGFVDDNLVKVDLAVQGVPILGTRWDIPQLVERYEVDEIIIAIPSASGQDVREIAAICEGTKAALKILPGVYDILSGKLAVSSIRQVQVEDLLGREPVALHVEEVAGYLKGQVVLVTGAGGSIGSELCRQICSFEPAKLILGGHGENSIFEIQQELKGKSVAAEIFDVRDRSKVRRILSAYRPDVIFHAAAHKHVPLMEGNPEEALTNNVLGTFYLASEAHRIGVKTFVMISTDKAVNPTSVMGASKRLGEMLIQGLNAASQTKFAAVRFGNVLGSRGSVIPTFKKQIATGGPVTVTHPEMTRYFMTIPEACQLVIQAGAMASGGEVFVLDMGEPVRIMELAQTLIRLSGFEPDQEIKIVFSGIRPGEKLYEELLTAEEGTSATKHSRIFVARPNDIDVETLQELVSAVEERGSLMTQDEVIAWIRKLLPSFRV